MKIQTLTFITGNPAKAEQLTHHLNYPVTHKKLDLPEIQSLDLREIVKRKAKEAYKEVGGPVIVEDTSLIFHALGKLPGPLIKWFLTELDNDGLCKLLDGYEERNAIGQVCVGLYDGREIHFFEGEQRGMVAQNPRGEKGFGWDPIFIPEGHAKTWGEMDREEQKETSMRRVALKKLEKFLAE